MKELLSQYAAYNYWANKKITGLAVNLTDAQLKKETPSSFNTIFSTLLHLWDVELGWYNRLTGKETPEWPGKNFNGGIIELANGLLAQSAQWTGLLQQFTEEELLEQRTYTNIKNETYTQPVYEQVHHLFNHQSFHRGQIITLMHNAGVSGLPSTDFISFARKH